MRTVIVLAGLVALALAGTVPSTEYNVKLKTVDAQFVGKQKKVLSLFENVFQIDTTAEYYKIGKEYNIESHADNYTNKLYWEEFWTLFRSGFLQKSKPFSIFYERQRKEAIALYHLFFSAKDFETFYKTAAWARVYMNEAQFVYAYYIAIIHREDTKGIVLPAPYEVYPELFINMNTWYKLYRVKMQKGVFVPKLASQYGIEESTDGYTFYSNYTKFSYDKYDQKLAYFTEDVGLNSYYYYFHTFLPFWMKGDFLGILKERRGEGYYFFYQQLLARYYLERLANGLGEIPKLSWYSPVKTGYKPNLFYYYPLVQRNQFYDLHSPDNYEALQYLDTYEKTFLQFLQKGYFKSYNREVDFHNSKSINFVGNYWQRNFDFYDKMENKNHFFSYETTARRVLGAAPMPLDKHTIMPTALDNYQTSLRDPVFYQLYNRILSYFFQYKKYLEPYKQENLHWTGVKINDVKVDKLVTYFDYFDIDATNGFFMTAQELNTTEPYYKIRQHRLNHKPFTVSVDIKSDFEGDAVFKFFIGPKYDVTGKPITLVNNWMNFVELDWFVHKLTHGQNKIERSSGDFFHFKEDSVPMREIYKFLEQGKVPTDMSEDFDSMPNRLMLPKGTEGGSPFQLYVFVYPFQTYPGAETEPLKSFVVDNKPFGYPFDRPVIDEYFFKQPNMYFKDVKIFYEHFEYQNMVPKQ